MNARAATDADLRAVISDPVRFARGLLRADLWPVQADILRAVAAHPRTAVKACHASGKTFVAAATVLWWTTPVASSVTKKPRVMPVGDLRHQ